MGLGERRRVGRERAVDLVGRDVEEAEGAALGLGEARPVLARRLEQVKVPSMLVFTNAAGPWMLRSTWLRRRSGRPRAAGAAQQRVEQRPVEDVAVDEVVARVAVEAARFSRLPA
jgi:hypothetical protein